MKRIADLQGKELAYWEDELYSDVAIWDLEYRAALEEAMTKADPQRGVSISSRKDKIKDRS